MLHVVSLKRPTFTTSRLVQLVPVAPLESPLSRLEQVVSIGQPSLKGSSRNEGFIDKKRMGRPKVLNEAAKKVLKKAKYKRGIRRGRSHNSKQARALLGEKHRLEIRENRRLEAAKTQKKYKNLTTEKWDDLFSDEYPKYLFRPKNDIV